MISEQTIEKLIASQDIEKFKDPILLEEFGSELENEMKRVADLYQKAIEDAQDKWASLDEDRILKEIEDDNNASEELFNKIEELTPVAIDNIAGDSENLGLLKQYADVYKSQGREEVTKRLNKLKLAHLLVILDVEYPPSANKQELSEYIAEKLNIQNNPNGESDRVVNFRDKFVEFDKNVSKISGAYSEDRLIKIGDDIGFEWTSAGTKPQKVKKIIIKLNLK